MSIDSELVKVLRGLIRELIKEELKAVMAPEEKPTLALVAPGNAAVQSTPAQIAKATWAKYSDAYVGRYSTLPVRNAMVNGQIAQIVKRLGEHAPDVAAWYLTHGGVKYVANGHSIGMLLAHAEQLHTEWATGRKMTQTIARQSDQTETNRTVFGGLLAREEAKQ